MKMNSPMENEKTQPNEVEERQLYLPGEGTLRYVFPNGEVKSVPAKKLKSSNALDLSLDSKQSSPTLNCENINYYSLDGCEYDPISDDDNSQSNKENWPNFEKESSKIEDGFLQLSGNEFLKETCNFQNQPDKEVMVSDCHKNIHVRADSMYTELTENLTKESFSSDLSFSYRQVPLTSCSQDDKPSMVRSAPDLVLQTDNPQQNIGCTPERMIVANAGRKRRTRGRSRSTCLNRPIAARSTGGGNQTPKTPLGLFHGTSGNSNLLFKPENSQIYQFLQPPAIIVPPQSHLIIQSSLPLQCHLVLHPSTMASQLPESIPDFPQSNAETFIPEPQNNTASNSTCTITDSPIQSQSICSGNVKSTTSK